MTVEVFIEDRIARVTLNRPLQLNSFDERQIAELLKVTADLASDSSLKAAVVTGKGRAFSVGLDLDLLEWGFAEPSWFMEQLELFGTALTAWENLPFPTIAAVNGVTRAGGFELMLCCDVIVVDSAARVGDTHLVSGLPPGGGATARLPRRIGWQRANEILLTGRWIPPKELAEIGLAAAVVDELNESVAGYEALFRGLSRPALEATKGILRDSSGATTQEALRVELEHFERFVTEQPSASEGFRAFREGREPRWD